MHITIHIYNPMVLDKRTGPSASSGLWFGPRLGKRSVDAKSFEDTNKGQKEFN